MLDEICIHMNDVISPRGRCLTMIYLITSLTNSLERTDYIAHSFITHLLREWWISGMIDDDDEKFIIKLTLITLLAA